MCATCGCSEGAVRVTGEHRHDHDHGHGHGHGHDRGHGHGHGEPHTHVETNVRTAPATRVIQLEQDILAKNDLLATRNRDWFADRGILALNLMSSPGAGKTTLLERTIRDVGPELGISVVEGDQETLLDADRIEATGCRAVQINTGSGCHLDAEMLERGLRVLQPTDRSVVMIENVGNLVCPALFDLGERAKVVIMSVTEGADKPLKYPQMFRAAGLMLLNKVDLCPYVDFDTARCASYAQQVNPALTVLEVSATRGDGLDAWYSWLRAQRDTP